MVCAIVLEVPCKTNQNTYSQSPQTEHEGNIFELSNNSGISILIIIVIIIGMKVIQLW